MKLTSFHLDGSRVYLAPIGPGFNVVHCPTGNRTAPVSESMRAVLFGAMYETGWPTAEGHLIGSVDVADEWGSGRVSRRNTGHGLGPLELSLHDGRSQALSHRIEEMARSAGNYQIIDFGNGRELTELALRVCAERLEVDPHWQPQHPAGDPDWDRQRESLQHRQRELLELREQLTAERERRLHTPHGAYAASGSPNASHRPAPISILRQQQSELRRELDSAEQRLSRLAQVADTPPSPEATTADRPSDELAARARSLDAQMDRIEQVCDDLDARLAEINHQLHLQTVEGQAPAVRSLEELRRMAAALERQLSWLDADRHSPLAPSDGERWETESSELRRTVADLLQTITRQERSLTVDTLRDEAKQIRRCRSRLRQRLRRLWTLREHLGRTGATPTSPASTQEAAGLRTRRDEIIDRLRQLDDEIRRHERSGSWSSAPAAAGSPADDDTRRRLESVEAELSEVRRQLHERPATPAVTRTAPEAKLMHHAAMQLSQLSEGELVSLRYDAPTNTLFVTDYEGKPHASYDLPLDVQRLVALSLLLSFADARFPVVLDRVFEETPETATASVLEVLRDSCRDGMQILAIVYDHQVAERLHELQVEIRHADWAAPQDHLGRRQAGQAQQPEAPAAYAPAYAAPPAGFYGPMGYVPAAFYPVAGGYPQAGYPQAGFYGGVPSEGAGEPRHPMIHRRADEGYLYTPHGATIWDTHSAGGTANGRPEARKTITPQAVRIFEDSYRPVMQAEAHSHRHHLDYADSVTRIPYFGRAFAERLEQYGYWTVADFLRGDAEEMVQQLSGEVSVGALRTWQAQCQLMCGIARLRAFDAKILVACGISDPLQLQNMDPREMMRRVATFMETPEGKQLMRSGTPFEISRIRRWIGGADEKAESDGRTGRYSRRVGNAARTARGSRGRTSTTRTSTSRSKRTGSRQAEDRPLRAAYGEDYQVADFAGGEGESEDFSQEQRAERRSRSSQSDSRGTRGKSKSKSRSGGSRKSSARGARSSRKGQAGRSSRSESGSHSARLMTTESQDSESSSGVLTFYLDMHSDVEAAPTIGPKTAELLYEIGIHTVGHLLEATPAEVAEQLNHSRISANNVLEWQLQSALVCRVPGLRGHDAQILVACGVTEAEQLAAHDPDDLYALVAPFVKSKAGKRLVRSGKAPDLEEVTDWINFAKQARQLKAA